MNHDAWLTALAGELRRNRVGPDLAGHVVAEAATHLRDSGEPPLRVFGPPEAYAAAVADSVGGPDVRPPRRTPLIMALTVLVAAPFGLTLSALLPRELEGTLVLLVVVGLQMMMDPAGAASRVLPFWFSREIGTYAIDHTDGGYLVRGVVHGAAFALALTAVVAIASGVRLRQRSHLRIVSSW